VEVVHTLAGVLTARSRARLAGGGLACRTLDVAGWPERVCLVAHG
jgi:hypothetical protein